MFLKFNVVIPFLMALSLVYPISALGKELELKPLTLYLSDDPYNLWKDGSVITGDIYSPTTLLEKSGQISFQYELENVLNVDDNKNNIKIGSVTKNFSGMIPFRMPLLKKNTLAFSLRDFDSQGDITDINEGILFRSSQKYRVNTISYSTRPISIIKAGIGWEDYNRNDNLFYEVSFVPIEPVSVNYRKFQRDMQIETSLIKDEHLARINLNPSEDVGEIFIQANVQDKFRINIAAEDNDYKNVKFSLAASLGSNISAGSSMMRRHHDFLNNIIIDDTESGHISGLIDYSSNSAEIVFNPDNIRYMVGVEESLLNIEGGGKVTGDSILNFWEDMIAGERFFNYNLKIRSTIYHLGVENKTTERLILRGGIQYILTTPEGNLDHWTPFPIIQIGRLDEEIINLDYRWARLGVLAFGFSYRFRAFELAYEFGQIIPLKIKKVNEIDGVVSETESAIGEGGWDLENIWNFVKDNPGGNLQSIRLTWYL